MSYCLFRFRFSSRETFLHPKFRSMKYLDDPEVVSRIKKKLLKMASSQTSNSDDPDEADVGVSKKAMCGRSNSNPKKAKLDIHDFGDVLFEEDNLSPPEKNSVEYELKTYESDFAIGPNGTIESYWHSRKNLLAKLYNLVLSLYCILPSEPVCERAFSHVARIVTKSRNSLDPNNVEILLLGSQLFYIDSNYNDSERQENVGYLNLSAQ